MGIHTGTAGLGRGACTISLGLVVQALLGALLSACAADSRPGTPEQVSASVEPIAGGAIDFNNEYEYVGKFWIGSGAESRSCTGILVSPMYVLTANHCITGSYYQGAPPSFGCAVSGPHTGAQGTLAGNIRFYFWPDVNAVPADHIAVHHSEHDPSDPAPPDQSDPSWDDGEIDVQQTTPIGVGGQVNTCGEDDQASWDIALIRLHARMQIRTVRPLHVSFFEPGGHGCNASIISDQNMRGVLVGYDGGSERKFYPSNGWRMREKVKAQQYWWENSWTYPTETYHGMESGDSGGALISLDAKPGFEDHLLCGVNSGERWEVDFDPIFPDQSKIFHKNEDAAIDSQANRAFLVHAGLLDETGGFRAECNAGTDPIAQDTDSDGDFIPDACDPCPHLRDPGYKLTGIIQKYGADSDWDGTPDICDNCPMDAPKPGWQGLSGQQDWDGDGVGNGCDLCSQWGSNVDDFTCCDVDADCGPNNLCLPFQSGPDQPFGGHTCASSKRCARSINHDTDDIGDLCDRCPTITSADNSDSDNDGLGDKCDNCPDTQNAQPCGASCGGMCTLTVPNVCVIQYDDPDLDGVGNSCDNCPGVWNNNQANCNEEMDDLQGIPWPYRGDVCDPMPCSDVVHVESEIPVHDPANPSNLIEKVLLRHEPLLLPPAMFLPSDGPKTGFMPTKEPKARVGNRFCPCSTYPWTASACKTTCQLNSSEYTKAGSAWLNMSERLPSVPFLSYTDEFSNLQVVDPRGTFDPVQDALPGWSVPAKVPKIGGNWWAPAGTEVLTTEWNLTLDAFNATGLEGKLLWTGVLWSHVVDLGGAVATTQFDQYSNHYSGGPYGKSLMSGSISKPGLVVSPCFFDPLQCKGCPWTEDISTIVIDPIDWRVFARNRLDQEDLTASVTQPALEMLATPGIKWASPAEQKVNKASTVRLAGVAANGTRVMATLGNVDGMLAEVRAERPRMALSENGVDDTAPSARHDFGLVLSALDSAMFVIGGVSDTTGLTMGDIWRFEIIPSQWMPLPLQGGFQLGAILGATYRSDDRSLYVLDEVRQNPHGKAVFARLVRISVDSGVATELGRWPRLQPYNTIFLSTSHRGDLVILSGSTQVGHYTGLIMKPNAIGQPTIRGGFHGAGVPVLPATVTKLGVTVPVYSQAVSVENVFISPADTHVTVHFNDCF